MWLAFAWASVSPLAILAQSAPEENFGRFKQVMHLDEIAEDAKLLIGAEYDVNAFGQQNKGFCLLTSSGGTSNLQGVESAYPHPSVIEVNGEHCIWQLQEESEGYVLFSPAAKMGVVSKKNSSSTLTLAANDWVKWRLDETESGTFMLHSLQDDSRALGLNWYGQYKIYFGLYKTTGTNPTRLHIFQQILNPFDMPGQAVAPNDGSRVAVVSNGRLLTVTDGQLVFEDATPYLLEDGTVLPSTHNIIWQCRYSDNDVFCLQDDSGMGLETVIENLSPNMGWKIVDGYFVTNETMPRYLVCLENGRLSLMPKVELSEKNISPVYFMPICEAPDAKVDANGVKLLTGGWSAEQLSNLDWKGITALDLSQLKLPLSVVEFVQRPQTSNAVVFVSADTKVAYISDWKNVVTCTAEGQYAWKNFSDLYDRNSWFVDRDIKIENGQLTYEREAYADGHWETLIVPFDAAVPADFEVGKFEPYDGGDALVVKKTNEIVANQPMLVRYVGKSLTDKTKLVLTNKEGWLKTYQSPANGLVGTYSPIDISAEHPAFYFLNAKGDTFVRATAGSHLAPFRVAFCLDATIKNMRVVFDDSPIAGIQSADIKSGKPSVYMLDGRKVRSALQEDNLKACPKGVYIVNGKKYLK